MKQHYLAQFYLKQWVGPDGRLCEFSDDYNRVKARMTHPGGTGYVKNLYTIKDAPPHIRDLFETSFLSVTDSQAAEALRLMVNDNIVPFDDLKFAWARFMMSLLYRTPEGVARSMEMTTIPTWLSFRSGTPYSGNRETRRRFKNISSKRPRACLARQWSATSWTSSKVRAFSTQSAT